MRVRRGVAWLGAGLVWAAVLAASVTFAWVASAHALSRLRSDTIAATLESTLHADYAGSAGLIIPPVSADIVEAIERDESAARAGGGDDAFVPIFVEGRGNELPASPAPKDEATAVTDPDGSTPAESATPTPGRSTETPAAGATSTPGGPTQTAPAGSTRTSTPAPQPTATLPAAPSNTPAPAPTNTPGPAATNTPAPAATNTPVPAPTKTPGPPPSNTPRPTNTRADNQPTPKPTHTPKP